MELDQLVSEVLALQAPRTDPKDEDDPKFERRLVDRGSEADNRFLRGFAGRWKSPSPGSGRNAMIMWKFGRSARAIRAGEARAEVESGGGTAHESITHGGTLRRACTVRRSAAAASNRRLEDAAVDWISQAVAEQEMAGLPDGEVLAICDAMIGADVQSELSGLLSAAREGALGGSERARLDELIALYRRGLVQKARAWKEAVARGLRASVGDAGADADHAA